MRMNVFRNPASLLIGAVSALSLLGASSVHAGTLRVVAWNIEDDIDGATTPLPGVNTVLQGVGNQILGGAAQPLDIMSLEETTSNAASVDPIVADLNGDYTGAKFETTDAVSDPNTATRFQGTESGGDATEGNGPNSIIWNANTVNLLQVVGVLPSGGTSALGSSSGEYREVVRYEFEAVGTTSPFYLYVSHMKSGSGSSDATARGQEATIIRNNEATLPANSSVVYMGDLNADPTQSGETQFSIFGATGQGSATDPAGYPTTAQYYSESATDIRYRDDYQLMTSNVINDTGALNYVAGTLNNFGNNGTTASGKSVNLSTNTALAYMNGGVYGTGNYPTQSQILSALTTASDHLPVVADYTFAAVPEPTSIGLLVAAGMLLPGRRRRA